ncbi:MAG: DUF2065 family protein [Gammaproteobacteria bacterium]|nr:DUF2065 family protein [Gammaproteobacteria bacterium]
MLVDFLHALALVLVIEGVMPFIAPVRLRAICVRLLQLDDRLLRVAGLLSMILGLLALQVIRWLT